MKARGKISRQSIDYLGERARSGCVLRYSVSGRGGFPVDMLRYDRVGDFDYDRFSGTCEGVEGDLTAQSSPENVREVRTVTIAFAHGCTPARWSSFGWSVHDNVEEVKNTFRVAESA
jgi:hypothetical protein